MWSWASMFIGSFAQLLSRAISTRRERSSVENSCGEFSSMRPHQALYKMWGRTWDNFLLLILSPIHEPHALSSAASSNTCHGGGKSIPLGKRHTPLLCCPLSSCSLFLYCKGLPIGVIYYITLSFSIAIGLKLKQNHLIWSNVRDSRQLDL